jgi:uncharacterized protein YcnI
MRKLTMLVCGFALVSGVASAHIMVSPPEAKTGVNQNYELRLHNEGKLATTSVDLEIPQGITVLDISMPPSGTVKTSNAGERITNVIWTVDVPPGKYVALKFTAKNPSAAGEVRWNVRQHLADGSVVDWSDKPGATQKASVTKISAASTGAAETQHGHGDHHANHDIDHDPANHGQAAHDPVDHDHGNPGRQ